MTGDERSLPELYHLLKLAHILGAAVLFGTGTGIAFFMLMAHRSRNVAAIAPTATIVVIADARVHRECGGGAADHWHRACVCRRLFVA